MNLINPENFIIEKKSKVIEDYSIIKKLACGGGSTVYLAKHKISG